MAKFHASPLATDDVPLLSVCVEGGPGTIDTVQKAVSVCIVYCCARIFAFERCIATCLSFGEPLMSVVDTGSSGDPLSCCPGKRTSGGLRCRCCHSQTGLYAQSYACSASVSLCGHSGIRKSEQTDWHSNGKLDQNAVLNVEQTEFWSVLGELGLRRPAYTHETEYNYSDVIEKLETCREEASSQHDKGVELLVRSAYAFGRLDKEDSTHRNKCYTALLQALQAADTGRCWVFNLHSVDGDDFNGSLLKCLLNGMSGNAQSLHPQKLKDMCQNDLAFLKTSEAREWVRDVEAEQRRKQHDLDVIERDFDKLKIQHTKMLMDTSWKKLKYIMLWNREDLLPEELDTINTEFPADKRDALLHKALVYAMQREKSDALSTLINYGAQVSFCSGDDR